MIKINIAHRYTHLVRTVRLFMALFVGALTLMMFAPGVSGTVSAACDDPDNVLGIPKWHKYIDGTPDNCRIISDGDSIGERLGETGRNVAAIFIAVIEAAAVLGAVVAVVMVFWGGFNFMTTEGDSGKAASARKTVQNAAIGLGILLLSSRIVSFIGSSLT